MLIVTIAPMLQNLSVHAGHSASFPEHWRQAFRRTREHNQSQQFCMVHNMMCIKLCNLELVLIKLGATASLVCAC